MSRGHTERHVTSRIGWLRASVLGANDGIVSTASLIIGVAAASGTTGSILVAGAAGLVAGAMSMAAGEYVSVSSQADSERADVARETRELREQPEAELRELTEIYVGRGLAPELAAQVAEQLTAADALGSHARDELGISEITTAKPVQAAMASAVSFAVGAALPLAVVLVSPRSTLMLAVGTVSLLSLVALGALSASAGGARGFAPIMRVTFWGAMAMAATAGAGALFGAAG
ncbi:MAG: VIT family protein [Terricaulis sp.]